VSVTVILKTGEGVEQTGEVSQQDGQESQAAEGLEAAQAGAQGEIEEPHFECMRLRRAQSKCELFLNFRTGLECFPDREAPDAFQG